MSASSENSSILDGILWLETLLVGSFGVIVATLAIATVGASLLLGYTSWHRTIRVVFGIFVLFGAPAISAGLMRIVDARGALSLQRPVEEIRPADPKVNSPHFDPYAGAAVPNSGST